MAMAIKNPCLDCDLLHHDKNCDECKACSRRVEYIKILDDMSDGINMDGDAGKTIKERIDELDELAKRRFQMTVDEKEKNMTRAQEIEIVIKDICDECFTTVDSIRAGGRCPEDSKARRDIIERLISDDFKVPQAKIAALVGVSYPAVNLVVTKLRDVDKPKPATKIFKVDFTKYQDLYEFLIKESAYRFRTPEDQVLHMLRRERDSKNDS
jgi:hypothetical protein